MKRKIVKKRPLIINVLKKIGLFFALFGLLIISVSVLVFLIAGIIFGINQLLTEVNNTVLSILISAVLAITTFVLTKRHEYKLFNEKNSREKNINGYQEYIYFLLESYKQQNFDLMQLLEWNSKIILKISDDTVFRLNELVDAVVEKEDIDRYLISVIKGLRKEMGFSGERKELLDDSIRTEDLYNILLPWEEREENIIQQTKRKKKLKKTVDIVHNSLGKVAEKIDVLEKHNDEV